MNEVQSSFPNINVPRLFADLGMTEAGLRDIADLGIPHDNGVTSTSAIKTVTVADVLRIVRPYEEFSVEGFKAPSGVAEQPLGQAALDGAFNRLRNGQNLRESGTPAIGWFSVENGLFRLAESGALPVPADNGAIQRTEGADLSTEFDPEAEYEDRAVAVIHIPGYPIVVQVSPSSEAVLFPKQAVKAAYDADGSFGEHTAGSKLAEMGLVVDKQNPHTELTADRPGGPLPRQDQMARALIRGLVTLASNARA